MRGALLGAALTAAILVTPATGAVKPWQWTAAQASRNLTAAKPPAMPGDYTMTAATCAGAGAATQGRFTAFRCQATFKPTKLTARPRNVQMWMRVRHVGSGQSCVSFISLASIPAGCLALDGARTLGTKETAEQTLKDTLSQQDGSPYTGAVSCTGIGAGYYPCRYGGGNATVVFHASGPAVTL